MAPCPSSSDGDNREKWTNLQPTEENPWFLNGYTQRQEAYIEIGRARKMRTNIEIDDRLVREAMRCAPEETYKHLGELLIVGTMAQRHG
jgi:hypothetical protein